MTHGHPDHFGAAGWIAANSDAVVVAGRAEAPKLLGGFDRTHLGGMVADLGIPDEVRASFSSVWDVVRGMTHPIDPDRLWLVDDGDTLNAGGRTWQAHVTPGHAVGHLSLYDPTDRTLLSGDHLLACITPNPVLEPDTDTPHGRRRSLVEYLDSLERFCRMDPISVLPGHGPAFTDVPTLATAMRTHHGERADDILRIIETAGEPTPFDLVGHLFPQLTGFSIMLGISEIVGHLDLLERRRQRRPPRRPTPPLQRRLTRRTRCSSTPTTPRSPTCSPAHSTAAAASPPTSASAPPMPDPAT